MYDAEDPNEKKEFDANMMRLKINFENMEPFSCSKFQETEREITQTQKKLEDTQKGKEEAEKRQKEAQEAQKRAEKETEDTKQREAEANKKAEAARADREADRKAYEQERQNLKVQIWETELAAGFNGDNSSNEDVRARMHNSYPWKSGSW